jgi:nucleotide-binding universal stress UspA family protein
MSLKTILVAASGGGASDGAVETACRLAKRLEAHLEGLHVRADPTQLLSMMGGGDAFNMPISGEWIDRFIADAEELAQKTRAAFMAVAGRHGVAAAAAWREETGYAPVLVAQRARFFDLVVLGRSERVVERPHTDTVEETLIHSGRPVLLAPAKPPAVLGDSIAVGWNGTPEAVHVLAASLPLLAAARAVSLITVGDEPEHGTLALIDYLAWHDIHAKHRQVRPVSGVGPGEQLLADARDEGADLLVMGGYGHRPWRELLFGGATRQVIGTSLLPVLLAH